MIDTSPSRLGNTIKTAALLAGLAAILIATGGLLAGRGGMLVALVVAAILNLGAWWFSDSLALKANGAVPVAPGNLPVLERTVSQLASQAGIPTPRLYLIDRPEPNAFATGRSPSHAAVAVTSGLLGLMDERQLRGVLAHELSHVVNRDTLVGSIAATIGGAVSWLAQMAQFSMIFGGGSDDQRGGNPLGLLAAIILAPLAALIVQMAVSRSREFGADRSGARLTGDPEGLASALLILDAENRAQRSRPRLFPGRGGARPAPVPAATAHLYTVSPLSADGLGSLFSTHPPIAERVRRLRGQA